MVASTVQDAFSRFRLSINLVVLLVVSSSSLFALSDGLCGECALDQICCNAYCIYESSCYGFSCTYDLDCSSGESCCFGVCVNGSSCLGHSCWSDTDCSFGESCCSKKCIEGYDCAGSSCLTDSDCGDMDYCCGGTCGHDSCTYDFVLVIGALVGVLFLLLVISLVVLLIYRRKRPRRVLLGQSLPAQAYQTFQDSSAPSYQQSYPYSPLPKYEECSPQQLNEPPPPYNSETRGYAGE